jgi:hypothetical protein
MVQQAAVPGTNVSSKPAGCMLLSGSHKLARKRRILRERFHNQPMNGQRPHAKIVVRNTPAQNA